MTLWRYGAISLLLLAAGGCRACHYFIREPVASQVLEVKANDRWYVHLDENGTTGYQWVATSDSPEVRLQVEHRPPKAEKGLCGAPGKAVVTMHILPGFSDMATVTLSYRRSWSGETAREVVFALYRNVKDTAPWR